MTTPTIETAVLPGEGWCAVFDGDDGNEFLDGVVCWVIKKYRTGRVQVVGMVPGGPGATKAKAVQEASAFTNFVGYRR